MVIFAQPWEFNPGVSQASFFPSTLDTQLLTKELNLQGSELASINAQAAAFTLYRLMQLIYLTSTLLAIFTHPPLYHLQISSSLVT